MSRLYVSNYFLQDWYEGFDARDSDLAYPSIAAVVLATTDDPQTDPAIRKLIEHTKELADSELRETYDQSYLEPESRGPETEWAWTETWDSTSVRLSATEKPRAAAATATAEGDYEGLHDDDKFAHQEELAAIVVSLTAHLFEG